MANCIHLYRLTEPCGVRQRAVVCAAVCVAVCAGAKASPSGRERMAFTSLSDMVPTNHGSSYARPLFSFRAAYLQGVRG